MNDLGIWYIVGMVQGVAMTLVIFIYRFKKYRENWSEGWKVGDIATVDTIGSGDVDLIKHHGESLPIIGFTPDRRACFVLLAGVAIDERENVNEVRVRTYSMFLPLKALHRVKPPGTPVP